MRDLLSPSHFAGRLAGFSTVTAALARSVHAGIATARAHRPGVATDLCCAQSPCLAIPPSHLVDLCWRAMVGWKCSVTDCFCDASESKSVEIPELDGSNLPCAERGNHCNGLTRIENPGSRNAACCDIQNASV